MRSLIRFGGGNLVRGHPPGDGAFDLPAMANAGLALWIIRRPAVSRRRSDGGLQQRHDILQRRLPAYRRPLEIGGCAVEAFQLRSLLSGVEERVDQGIAGDRLQRSVLETVVASGAESREAFGRDGCIEFGGEQRDAQDDDEGRQQQGGEEDVDNNPASQGQTRLHCFDARKLAQVRRWTQIIRRNGDELSRDSSPLPLSSGRCRACTVPRRERRYSQPACPTSWSAWRRFSQGGAARPSRRDAWAACRPSSRTSSDWSTARSAPASGW